MSNDDEYTEQVARSSVTGRFVRLRWALRHPRRSIVQTIRRRRHRA